MNGNPNITTTTGECIERTFIVARKELLALFETPVAYIAAILFLVVSEFLFFKNVFLVGEASLTAFFNFLPWLALLFVPALTMGSFSQERETGTYEALITKPFSHLHVLLGKFTALSVFVSGTFALAVFPITFAFSFVADLDIGAIVGGYIGAVLFALATVALGLYISSLFTKQISALLVTIVTLFFLIIAGTDFIAGSVPVELTRFFERLSIVSHYSAVTRGVLDVRDLWYFASVSIAFLVLTRYRMLSLSYGRRHSTRASARTTVLLVVATVLLSNVLGSAIPGRFDLTEDRIYTLSDATRERLALLPDLVTITLYASEAIPAQLQPILRDTRDLLSDYERYGNGNVQFLIVDPTKSDEAKTEARTRGVMEVQFNVMGQSELSVKQGFLGLSISHKGDERAIPFIDNTNDLEYKVTSMIAELSVTDKKHVRFLTGAGERSQASGYQTFESELRRLYDVSTVTGDELREASTSLDVLIVAGTKQQLATGTREALESYLAQGRPALFLLSGVTTNTAAMTAQANTSDVFDVLGKRGITVGRDLVYDLRSNEVVQLQGGAMVYLVSYPFWARALAVPGHPITTDIKSVMMPWSSTVRLDEALVPADTYETTPLVRTSASAGVMTDAYDIQPNAELSNVGLSERTLAYAIRGAKDNPMRLVVFGNDEFLTDQIVGRDPGNMALGIGAVSWLAEEPSLGSIKARSGVRRAFTFEEEYQQALVSYGTMAFSLLFVIGLGTFLYVRRRALSTRTYSERPLG